MDQTRYPTSWIWSPLHYGVNGLVRLASRVAWSCSSTFCISIDAFPDGLVETEGKEYVDTLQRVADYKHIPDLVNSSEGRYQANQPCDTHQTTNFKEYSGIIFVNRTLCHNDADTNGAGNETNEIKKN